jgi:hypothetical protein
MRPGQVTQFFRERMLPQNGWFKSRMAGLAQMPSPASTASVVPPALARTE